jgi:hypothetical protein
LYLVDSVEAAYPFDSLRSSEHRVVKRRARRVKAPEATALLVIVPGAPYTKKASSNGWGFFVSGGLSRGGVPLRSATL